MHASHHGRRRIPRIGNTSARQRACGPAPGMGQVPGRAQAIMEAQGACPPPPPRKHFATQRRRPGVMCVGGVCTLVARARTRPAPSVCVGVGVGGRAARVAEQGADPHPPTHHHRHHQTHTHTHTRHDTAARPLAFCARACALCFLVARRCERPPVVCATKRRGLLLTWL